jgi:hypothetical protein
MTIGIYQNLIWCITCSVHRVEKDFKVGRILFEWQLDLGLRKKYLKVNKNFSVRIKESARQTHVFPCVEEKRMANTWVCRAPELKRMAKFFTNNDIWFLRSAEGEKNTLLWAMEKMQGKQEQDLCRAFFLCRAPYKKHTANKTFAVHPK